MWVWAGGLDTFCDTECWLRGKVAATRNAICGQASSQQAGLACVCVSRTLMQAYKFEAGLCPPHCLRMQKLSPRGPDFSPKDKEHGGIPLWIEDRETPGWVEENLDKLPPPPGPRK